MDGKIQAKISKIDSKQIAAKIVKIFREYLNKILELEKEYLQIPSWRFFKQMKNIRKREKLNRDYKVKMFELGVLI